MAGQQNRVPTRGVGSWEITENIEGNTEKSLEKTINKNNFHFQKTVPRDIPRQYHRESVQDDSGSVYSPTGW
jgi:hypothetical protein